MANTTEFSYDPLATIAKELYFYVNQPAATGRSVHWASETLDTLLDLIETHAPHLMSQVCQDQVAVDEYFTDLEGDLLTRREDEEAQQLAELVNRLDDYAQV